MGKYDNFLSHCSIILMHFCCGSKYSTLPLPTHAPKVWLQGQLRQNCLTRAWHCHLSHLTAQSPPNRGLSQVAWITQPGTDLIGQSSSLTAAAAQARCSLLGADWTESSKRTRRVSRAVYLYLKIETWQHCRISTELLGFCLCECTVACAAS